jgi:hypothetical protein
LSRATVDKARFIDCDGLFGKSKAVLTEQLKSEWVIVSDRFEPSWEFIGAFRGFAIFGVSGALVGGILGYIRIARWYNDLTWEQDLSSLERRVVAILPGPIPVFPELYWMLTATLIVFV